MNTTDKVTYSLFVAGLSDSVAPVTDEELRKLSPFRDLVEGLDLDNLGETDSEE